MKDLGFLKKYIFIFAFLPASLFAGIAPVFQKDKRIHARSDEMARVFITPMRIVSNPTFTL